MNNSENALVYWGLVLAAGAYIFLFLRLLHEGYQKATVNRIAVAMLVATLFTVIWSGFSLLALTVGSVWWLGAQSADVLRYLCWGVFVALFFKPYVGGGADRGVVGCRGACWPGCWVYLC